jgi:dihydroorotate dehydrogenase (fumarate)
MIDLSTNYLGLRLRSPIVASASPLTGEIGSLRALDAAGVGAVVLPSLFEEQILHDSYEVDRALEAGAWANAEAPFGYLPELEDYNTGPVRYLRLVEEAKRRLDVPVIASLNGYTAGGWTSYARLIAEAGADAIELNLYRVNADPTVPARAVEADNAEIVASVRESVRIPIAVKLSPFFTSLAHLLVALAEAGADGFVLFNRFYQPDIDLETLDVVPHLVLSDSDELRLPLRWIAMLHGRVEGSLAATTGVHTVRDVVKVLLAGADVAMMTSAILRHGPDHVTAITDELRWWMLERDYGSVEQMKGSVSQRAISDPSAYERAQYVRTLVTYSPTFRR